MADFDPEEYWQESLFNEFAGSVANQLPPPPDSEDAIATPGQGALPYEDDFLDPTSTSNPMRPRTLAAHWRAVDSTLIVMFRDGTIWEYPGVVDRFAWNSFRAAVSKGAWIYTNLDRNGYHGQPSDDPDLFWSQPDLLARVQQERRGIQFGQSQTSQARAVARQAVARRQSVIKAMGYRQLKSVRTAVKKQRGY